MNPLMPIKKKVLPVEDVKDRKAPPKIKQESETCSCMGTCGCSASKKTASKKCPNCGKPVWDVATVDQHLNKCWECGTRWQDDPDDDYVESSQRQAAQGTCKRCHKEGIINTSGAASGLCDACEDDLLRQTYGDRDASMKKVAKTAEIMEAIMNGSDPYFGYGHFDESNMADYGLMADTINDMVNVYGISEEEAASIIESLTHDHMAYKSKKDKHAVASKQTGEIKKKATGEPDQDYDHETYDEIVKGLEEAGYQAKHREFDKYQGVYIKVNGQGTHETFWTEDFFSSGVRSDEGAKYPYKSVRLYDADGELAGGSKGDYFMLAPDKPFPEGYTLELTKADGTKEVIEHPTYADFPESIGQGSQVEPSTFTFKPGTSSDHYIFYPESDSEVKIQYDAGSGDVIGFTEYLESKKNVTKGASMNRVALKLWTTPVDYMGEEYPDYYVGPSQTRDSEAMERSNFKSALEMLGGEKDGVIVVRFGHWAVGWVETILVHKDAKEKVEILQDIESKIANYPVLDEEDYYQTQADEYREDYESWARADALAMIKKHLHSSAGAGEEDVLARIDDYELSEKADQALWQAVETTFSEYGEAYLKEDSLIANADDAITIILQDTGSKQHQPEDPNQLKLPLEGLSSKKPGWTKLAAEKVFTCPETDDLSGICHLCHKDLSGHDSEYRCQNNPDYGKEIREQGKSSKKAAGPKNIVGLFGTFNGYGYQIYTVDQNGQLIDKIYGAGNNKLDSGEGQQVEPGSPGAVSVEQIEKFCEQTGQELAKEKGLEWTGMEYDQESESSRREVTQETEEYLKESAMDSEPCPNCGGEGHVDGEECAACEGSGRLPKLEAKKAAGEKRQPYIAWDTGQIAEDEAKYFLDEPESNDHWMKGEVEEAWEEAGHDSVQFKTLLQAKDLVTEAERQAQDAAYSDSDIVSIEWDSMVEDLSAFLEKKNPSGRWLVSVEGFGWRKLNGQKVVNANDGTTFLREVLPDTDVTFYIYDEGGAKFSINNFHHDSPTGEWYYAEPAPAEEDIEAESSQRKAAEDWDTLVAKYVPTTDDLLGQFPELASKKDIVLYDSEGKEHGRIPWHYSETIGQMKRTKKINLGGFVYKVKFEDEGTPKQASTPQQERAIKAILSNDEASSDAELVAHLEKEIGISAAEAQQWVSKRDSFLKKLAKREAGAVKRIMLEAEEQLYMSDQPVTCPKCGGRTDFTEGDGKQDHTCLGCGHKFEVVEEDEPMVGDPEWTDLVMKESEDYFAKAHLVPDEEDLISYIRDIADNEAGIDVTMDMAAEYFLKWHEWRDQGKTAAIEEGAKVCDKCGVELDWKSPIGATFAHWECPQCGQTYAMDVTGSKRKADFADEHGIADDEPEEPQEPAEDDVVIQSEGQLGAETVAYAGGKQIAKLGKDDWDGFYNAIYQWMEKSNFFPNVWHLSDHGNYALDNDFNYYVKERQQRKTAGRDEEIVKRDVELEQAAIDEYRGQALDASPKLKKVLDHVVDQEREHRKEFEDKKIMSAQICECGNPIEPGLKQLFATPMCKQCLAEERQEQAGERQYEKSREREASSESYQGYGDFVGAYLEAALWSSMDESDEQGGDPMDQNYDFEDIAPESIEKAKADCAAFKEKAGDLLNGMDESQAGHDFWLTRNRHGAGFWDRGLGEVGDKLTEIAHSFGETHLYVGDDGKIYAEGGMKKEADGDNGPEYAKYKAKADAIIKKYQRIADSGRIVENLGVKDLSKFRDEVSQSTLLSWSWQQNLITYLSQALSGIVPSRNASLDKEAADDSIRMKGPGKFATIIDEILWTMSLDGGPDEEIGEAEMGGWYGLMKDLNPDEAEKYAEELGVAPLTAGERQWFVDNPFAIIGTESSGFVGVNGFSDEASAMKLWNDIVADMSPAEGEEMGTEGSVKVEGKYTGNLEADLKAIAPYVIADGVSQNDNELSDWLVQRAMTIYKHNPEWGKKISKDNEAARDMLGAFMQHWAEGRRKNPNMEPNLKSEASIIPKDFEVQPLKPGENPLGKMTCGTCGLSWDDDISTSWTPVPSGRCPFEYFHEALLGTEAGILKPEPNIEHEGMMGIEAGLTDQVKTLRKKLKELDVEKADPSEIASTVDALEKLEKRLKEQQESRQERKDEKAKAAEEATKVEAGLTDQVKTLRKKLKDLDVDKADPSEIASTVDALEKLEKRLKDQQETRQQKKDDKEKAAQEATTEVTAADRAGNFLNTPDDVQWLQETALKNNPEVHGTFESFVLYGNEDAPEKLELFQSTDPTVDDKPVSLVLDFENKIYKAGSLERESKLPKKQQVELDRVVQNAVYGYRINIMDISKVYSVAEAAYLSGQDVTEAVHKLLDTIAEKTASLEVTAATNEQVIQMFATDSFPKDKMPTWGTQHLKINKEPGGWSLINYTTPIAYRSNEGKTFVNTQKYSQTTSRIQKVLLENMGSAAQVDEGGMRAAMQQTGNKVEADMLPQKRDEDQLNGYVCFYKNKQYEVYAKTSYEAQQKCAKEHGIKKAYDITVVLAEKGGEQVTHNPQDVVGSMKRKAVDYPFSISGVKADKLGNGDLEISIDKKDQKELADYIAETDDTSDNLMYDLFENITTNGYMWVSPEDIGALTDAPILSDGSTDDQGKFQNEEGVSVWWYPNYMVRSPVQDLAETGRTIFTFAPAEKEEPAKDVQSSQKRYAKYFEQFKQSDIGGGAWELDKESKKLRRKKTTLKIQSTADFFKNAGYKFREGDQVWLVSGDKATIVKRQAAQISEDKSYEAVILDGYGNRVGSTFSIAEKELERA